MQLYSIANWKDIFETSETRKLDNLRWVPTPNKHDGLGFRRVAAEKDSCELFAAWNLMLQIASKGEPSQRGKLMRDGQPLTPVDLAMMTGFPKAAFARAFDFFSTPKIGWLTSEPFDNQCDSGDSGTNPGQTGTNPGQTLLNGMEGKGTEGKEVVGANGSHPAAVSDSEWVASLEKGKAYEGINIPSEHERMILWCQAHRKKPTRNRFLAWLNRIEKPMSGTVKKPYTPNL